MDDTVVFGLLVIVALIGYACDLWVPPLVKWLKKRFGCRNRRQKPEKFVNGKCKHRLVFSRNCQDNRGNVFPIYKCEKCGYEQIGKEHLKLEEYEN